MAVKQHILGIWHYLISRKISWLQSLILTILANIQTGDLLFTFNVKKNNSAWIIQYIYTYIHGQWHWHLESQNYIYIYIFSSPIKRRHESAVSQFQWTENSMSNLKLRNNLKMRRFCRSLVFVSKWTLMLRKRHQMNKHHPGTY